MSDTLAKLVVALEVESAALRKGLDQANARLDGFGRKADEASKSFSAAFAKINKTAEGLKDTITSSLAFSVARDAVAGLWSVVKEGSVALAEEQKSVAQLEAALGQLGGSTSAMLAHFEAQTEELERLTLVDDKAIRSIQQLQIQMGIAPRAVEATTRAILDYSAATGQDAVSAARTLLAAVAGGKDEIAKMGIAIELTGDKTVDMERAAAALAARFGGSAQAATAGLAGQFGRLQKATEDAGKSLADYLQRTGVAEKVTNALTKALEGAAYALGREHEETQAAVERAEAWSAAMETRTRVLDRLQALEANRAKVAESARGFYDAEIRQEKERLALLDEKIAKLNAERAAASAASTAQAKLLADGAKAVATTPGLKTPSDNARADDVARKIADALKEVDVKSGFGGTGKSAAEALGMKAYGASGVNATSDFIRLQAKQSAELARVARERLEAERAFTEGLETAQAARLRAGVDTALGMGGNLGGAIAATAEGGLGGGILALLQSSEAFSSVLATLDEIFTMLANGLGGLLEPLLPLLQVSVMLDKALLLLLKPLESIITGAAPLLFEAFKGNALALLYIAEGIGSIYNGIVEAVASVLRDLSSIPFFDDLSEAADAMLGSLIDTGGFADAISEISGLTYEQAKAQRELTKATDQATASMLNVPSGWKVNLARFNAINPNLGRQSPGGSVGGGQSSPAPTGGSPGGGAAAPTPEVHVHLDGPALVNALRLEIRKGDARVRGNPAGLSPAYAGG